MNENFLKWLTPLGFIAFIAILVLILIYILKPNYQQRIVSSAYVWKLSLRYRKKRIPISKLRNIIIILCQILILSICSFILAQPFIAKASPGQANERIIIIDASASMLAETGNYTRFERAVMEVKASGQQTLTDQGMITVILASQKAEYIIPRTELLPESLDLFNSTLDSLTRRNELNLPSGCTFGEADIDGAIALAEKVLVHNPAAEITLYSATKYMLPENVTNFIVSDVSNGEWNAAILNATATLDGIIGEDGKLEGDGYYVFAVKTACYGRNRELRVDITVEGANADDETPNGKTLQGSAFAQCFEDQPDTVFFRNMDIFSFKSVRISIDVEDSFAYDNSFCIYDGVKETINVLYVTPVRHAFLSGFLMGLNDMLDSRWNFVVNEAVPADTPKLSGYDFYIFEYEMPLRMPTDGISFLIDPDSSPQSLNMVFGEKITDDDPKSRGFTLSPQDSTNGLHPIMKAVKADSIHVTKYTRVVSHEGFEPLMFCGANPVFFVKNQPKEKVAVLTFDLLYSDITLTPSFPVLLFNLFDYFLPDTITGNIYNVHEPVKLNAMGSRLTVIGPGMDETYTEFPVIISGTVPGTYTIKQTLLSDKTFSEDFYVRVSALQSDFSRVEMLKEPYIEEPPVIDYDLLLYLAIALVALVLFERFLHVRQEV